MQLGMVGLGRMGANMARRLRGGGHDVVVFDVRPEVVASLEAEGFTGTRSLAELAHRLKPPRTAWVMVPAGDPAERVIGDLAAGFVAGDLVVDGGNSFYKDDVRRAATFAERGVEYADVGTSGGTWGLERGYCLMVGGSPSAVERLAPALRTLSPGLGAILRTPGAAERSATAEQGWLHCGPVGAGHFVKMIHNGIEYGMMQAYAEGFDILRGAASGDRPPELQFDLDPAAIAELWRRGSVITSWLLDLTAAALVREPGLESFSGRVQDSGEGRWTVQAAVEEAVSAPVLTAALYARFRSRQEHTFGEKILSAMRAGFGGHAEAPKDAS
jgi:6-phosphogluconate dehydrogenase